MVLASMNVGHRGSVAMLGGNGSTVPMEAMAARLPPPPRGEEGRRRGAPKQEGGEGNSPGQLMEAETRHDRLAA